MNDSEQYLHLRNNVVRSDKDTKNEMSVVYWEPSNRKRSDLPVSP